MTGQRWSRCIGGVLALVIVLGVSAAAAPEPADTSALKRFVGTFEHVEAEAKAQARIDEAIDRSVQELNFLIRGLARDRITETNQIPRRIEVRIRGEAVDVVLGRLERTARLGAAPVDVTGTTGEKLAYTLRMKGNVLVQRFQGERGRRINRFELDGDRLILEVKVQSPSLPVDVVYRFRYRRT